MSYVVNSRGTVREADGPIGAGTGPSAGFLSRHFDELLTVLTLLFVLQTGIVPFDFQWGATEKGATGFFTTTVSHLTFPDTVANIFLYVPVGLLLHWTLSQVVRSRTLALLATIALAAVMSAGVEWVQAYSPARVSSIIDLAANIVGATLGALLSWVARGTAFKLLTAAICEARTRPLALSLKAYCLVLFFFACMPFSFSFDTLRLKKAAKAANFVPFRTAAVDAALSDDMLAEGDHNAYAHLRWQRMKRWSRWAAEAVSFAVLAWLLCAVLRRDYGFGRVPTMLLAVWLGGGCAVGLSALQLLVVSRACDVTDIVFRLLGLFAGLTVWAIASHRSGNPSWVLQSRSALRLVKAGCVAAAAYIFYTGMLPLIFDAGSGGPAASIASPNFLPFFAYFIARFDVMMIDVMEKAASYVVFSALLSFYLSYRAGFVGRPRALPVVAVGVTLATVIEVAQMFISVRVTGLTDPIVAAGGCLVGVYAQQHIVAFYRFARSTGVVAPEEAPHARAALAPADALIATLTEPHPEAPVEPSPVPKSRTPR